MAILISGAASVAMALIQCIAAVPAQAATPDLGDYLGKKRVLLVTAQTDHDPALDLQRRTFASMRAGAMDRDLVMVELTGQSAGSRALRERFGLDATAFEAILIGKDGSEKMRTTSILGPQQLFPTIDAMPMRRSEMQRR